MRSMGDKISNKLFISVSAAKAQLSALVERVIQGEEVIISRSGKPVIQLVPYSNGGERRKPGALKGQIVIKDDFEELPEEIVEAFELGD